MTPLASCSGEKHERHDANTISGINVMTCSNLLRFHSELCHSCTLHSKGRATGFCCSDQRDMQKPLLKY